MRHPLRLFVAAVALMSLSCFEEPVSESVEIAIQPGDTVQIRSTTTFRDEGGNPRSTARLAGIRESYLTESDAWSRRFAALEPDDDRYVRTRAGGKLVSVERSARVRDSRLPYFFADTSLTVTLNRMSGGGELAIYAARSTRATNAQSREVQQQIAATSTAVAEYVKAVSELYRYLERHPERAPVLLRPFFLDALPQSERDSLVEPAEDEMPLVERVSESMQDVAGILTLGDDREMTLDEMSRLVFDPFPSAMMITVPGVIEHVEGFERKGTNALTVRRAGLWDGLSAMENQWVAPDLLLPWVAAQRGESVDVDAIVGATREVKRLPSAGDVSREIERRLTPAATLRVRWRE